MRIDPWTVAPGRAAGVNQIGRGHVGDDEVLTLVFRASVGEKESEDRIQIHGAPAFDLRIPGGVNGDIGTCSIVTNAIPVVIDALPGLRTMRVHGTAATALGPHVVAAVVGPDVHFVAAAERAAIPVDQVEGLPPPGLLGSSRDRSTTPVLGREVPPSPPKVDGPGDAGPPGPNLARRIVRGALVLHLRGGATKISEGMQYGGGASLVLGPVNLSGAAGVVKGDLSDTVMAQFGLSFGNR